MRAMHAKRGMCMNLRRPAHVPLQLLGQVAGAAECSSNQLNLRLTELLTPIFTRVPTSCLLNVPKNHTIMLPKLPFSPESDIWIFFYYATLGPSLIFSSPPPLTFHLVKNYLLLSYLPLSVYIQHLPGA
jgi:hypothetical protein